MSLPELTCAVCGHSWNPRVPNPVECPNCKSYKWNVEKTEKNKNVSRVEHVMVSEVKDEKIDLKRLFTETVER